MSSKTNAVRILEQAGLVFEIREYEVDENDLSALHVAESLRIDPEIIYKTLILKSNTNEYLVALIPGNSSLDLKKMAKVSGFKNCEMVPVKDIQKITGYIRGGCSPIGMKKQFQTYIEELAQLQGNIIISAGKRGVQIIINPQDLGGLIDAEFADIIHPEIAG